MSRYIGKQPVSGNFVKLDAITTSATATYALQSGGSAFTPQSVNQMIVSLNGVIQAPTSAFTLSGSNIVFDSALTSSDVIDFILVLGDVNDIGTPSDNTVATAKIVNNAVTADKLASTLDLSSKTLTIPNNNITKAKTNFVSTSSDTGLDIKGDGSANGRLGLLCSAGSHGVKLESPDHSAGQSYTIKLPDNQIAVDKMIKIKSISGSGATAVGQAEFVDAPSGGLKLISRQSVSAATYVEFNQVMTTDHYQYIFFLEGVQPANNGVNLLLELQTSDESSGAYDTGSNYNHTAMRNNDGNSVAQTGQSALQLSRDGAGDNDSNRLYSGQINIANASSTTDHKMLYHFGGGRQQDGTFSGQLMFGTYEDTSRLTGARFKFSAGNFAAKGFISLYGLVTS